jgi:hypothetical protein
MHRRTRGGGPGPNSWPPVGISASTYRPTCHATHLDDASVVRKGMSWQERLRLLGDRLTAGEITTAEYRVESVEILAEADREVAGAAERAKVVIPVSAAWEAPSGEMTQIVGTGDRTRVVRTSIADGLGEPGDSGE